MKQLCVFPVLRQKLKMGTLFNYMPITNNKYLISKCCV